jgi:hypothetical protein
MLQVPGSGDANYDFRSRSGQRSVLLRRMGSVVEDFPVLSLANSEVQVQAISRRSGLMRELDNRKDWWLSRSGSYSRKETRISRKSG